MSNKEQRITQKRLQSSYLSSIISTTLVLFLLGVAGVFLFNAKVLTNDLKHNISINVYLNEGLKESDVLQFRKKLDASPFTRETKFISKDDAAKEFEAETGKDFLAILDNNPLPESLEIWIMPEYTSTDSITAISNRIETLPQVQFVKYERNFLDIINNNVNKINLIMGIFILLLLFVSIVLINNTIRLSIYAKRFEIYTMKLVGAKPSFISKPFLIHSIIRGLVSGLLAIALLYAALFALQKEFSDIFVFLRADMMLILSVAIILLGILINFISTYFAVHKFLKMEVNKLYA